ncbi:MAG: S23 ribosomal protein family protein [Parcubacteria group bacterium GW2011_GWB1_45_7]|nr:MAG: S23 ribosomal protein family protein [Parcubacteria group bacterium GW2011_GWB1_45_7]
MNSYRDLIVWQKSIKLVEEIYKLTSKFPKEEMFGLISQLRRATISIPSNIAEGFSRKSIKENIQFISIAFGSTSEVDTQLIIAKNLGMISGDSINNIEELLVEIRKMLNTMHKNLKQRSANG